MGENAVPALRVELVGSRAQGTCDKAPVGPRHGDQAEVLLRSRFSACGKLRHRRARRRLRRLPARVRVNLGIQHQQVDVLPAGDHMIEAAIADVIGPAVAAHDPHALLDQQVGQRQQLARR